MTFIECLFAKSSELALRAYYLSRNDQILLNVLTCFLTPVLIGRYCDFHQFRKDPKTHTQVLA